jgi:hypothetical protein
MITPERIRQGADTADVQRGTRALLVAFALLTGLAVYQLLLHGDATDWSWPWTVMTGATGGFLAAAYGAGFVLSLAGLRQATWRRVRVAVATVSAFTVLTLVATVVHAHRLHLAAADPLARAGAWLWVVIYLVVPVASFFVLGGQARPRRLAAPTCRPLPRWLARTLTGQSLVLGAAGVVLFAGGLTVHEGSVAAAAFWPWPLSPLSSMVIGSWLLALAVGTALGVREGDLDRLQVPAITYTAFGLFELASLVAHRGDVTGDAAALWGYVAVLAGVTATGAYGWWATRRGCRPAGQLAVRLPVRFAARVPEPRPAGSASGASNSAAPSSGKASTARLAKKARGVSSATISGPERWAGAAVTSARAVPCGSAAGLARPHSRSTSSSSASR